MENFQDLLTQTEQKNKQLKNDINNRLNLKKLWLKSYKKQKEKIGGCQKILPIWGQSLTPRLLALEKTERNQNYSRYKEKNDSYGGREHKSIQ